jgi:hypothetical protein
MDFAKVKCHSERGHRMTAICQLAGKVKMPARKACVKCPDTQMEAFYMAGANFVYIGRPAQASLHDPGSLSGNFKGDGDRSNRAIGPVLTFAARIEQLSSTILPFLTRCTAERFFETLGCNFDDAMTMLKRRKFHDGLSFDRFQARTEPARRAFQ